MPSDNAAVVRSLFEAFNDGDLVRAAATVSDDFELVDVAAGQTFRAPDGCRQWLEIFKTALPDAHTELVNVFAEGDRVASEHIGRGTHTGPFGRRLARSLPPAVGSSCESASSTRFATARSPTSTPTTTARP